MERNDLSEVHIQSSLPKPWEQQTTFNDVLYDWMQRAPWLLISAGAHLVLFLILAAFPWDIFRETPATAIQASIVQTPEEVFEDPPEEVPEEIEEQVPLEEPVLKDAEISDHNEDVTDQLDSMQGEPDFLADSPFDQSDLNAVIGIGGGAGGVFGNRFGGRRNLKTAGGSGIEKSIGDALEWLKEHQSPDGSWDCDGFMSNCGKIGATLCDGPGEPSGDVAMTGLALLAFLGDGNTLREGPYKDVVTKGVLWLRQQQDPDTGILGERVGHGWVYNHAMATLALCEAYYFSKNPILRRCVQDAVNLITRARNPYGVWRYDYPPSGDNDTSITGWMLMCLKSAKEGGLEIDSGAFDAVEVWLDEMTDPATGRVGYQERGSLAPRVERVNDHWPAEKGESLTSVGLLLRIFLGQDPAKDPILVKHADLIAKKPPVWDPEHYGTDVYYWYYGSYAMYQMGGSYWTNWSKAMKGAVVDSQRKDGDAKGSWDPLDAWGYAGGRVYETALMTLCLEVYYRYARVLGAR